MAMHSRPQAAAVFAAARADGVHPDVRSFATLINGYAQQNRLEEALEVGGSRAALPSAP